MSLRIGTVTFDCANPYLLADLSGSVTGYREDPGNRNHPDDPEGLLVAPDGSASLLFIRVPEAKRVRNRVRLDLTPPEPTPQARETETERVLALGATLVADHRRPGGTGWVVLADPEDNEFCIERGVPGG